MRLGIIGLGDIARKAYLPVLATRADLEPHLCTRDRAVLDELGDAYRIPHRHTDLDGLLRAGIEAAFVHAATIVHRPIVERLLDAGCHVYVDKPLDAVLAGAEYLVELAERRQRSLMVGFNRRYAPAYAELVTLPRDLIVMQKNRTGLAAEPRAVVFDDFIHVVDTLRFLVPDVVEHVNIRTRVEAGLLQHVVLQLSGSGFTALGIMNRVSGAAEESVEVSGRNRKRRVTDLAQITEYGEATATTRRGDWTPVARQRGIEQACDTFIAAVRAGELLSARDALETHALCERIVQAC